MGTGGSTLSIRRPFGARVQIIGKTGLLLRMASMAAAGDVRARYDLLQCLVVRCSLAKVGVEIDGRHQLPKALQCVVLALEWDEQRIGGTEAVHGQDAQ